MVSAPAWLSWDASRRSGRLGGGGRVWEGGCRERNCGYRAAGVGGKPPAAGLPGGAATSAAAAPAAAAWVPRRQLPVNSQMNQIARGVPTAH